MEINRIVIPRPHFDKFNSRTKIDIVGEKNRARRRNLQFMLDTIQGAGPGGEEDYKIMFNDIIENKWKDVLELGVDRGKSTIPLLVACYLNNGKLVSVDYKEIHEVNNWLNTHDCRFLKKHWRFRYGNDLNMTFRKKFDMIFLDTSHFYYQTRGELIKFSKLSKVIYCHDYSLPGIQKAIKDFRENTGGWEIEVFNTPQILAKLSYI